MNILLSICFFISLNIQAICRSNYKIEIIDTIKLDDDLITYIEAPAIFDGDLLAFINKELVYPQQALADSLEGTVHVSFLIDTSGQTFNHFVSRGINAELDEEALRIARLIHFKKPAMQRNKPIVVPWVVPIHFKLSDIHYLLNEQNKTSNQLKVIIEDSITSSSRNYMIKSFIVMKDSLQEYKITYEIHFKFQKGKRFITKISKEYNKYSSNNDFNGNKYNCETRCLKTNNIKCLKHLDYLYQKFKGNENANKLIKYDN